MERISIQNLGPIHSANVEFGDFTLLVGPQASGKSVFLQLVKLLADKDSIADILKSYGYVWDNPESFLELFFGEGMSQIWNKNTQIITDGESIEKSSLLDVTTDKLVGGEVFYMPAQRVITLQNGWPKPFSDFGNDPYVLKAFSESLRLFMDQGQGNALFPGYNNKRVRDHMYQSIYYSGEVEIDLSGHRKRFVLNIDGNKMPFMAWSAGQKEFMPLWLGMGILFYPTNRVNSAIKMVIVEEPEMGLHPQAIEHVIVQLLELMREGYKVVISTHSPMLLEFAWAMQFLKNNRAAASAVHELLKVENASDRINSALYMALNEKTFKAYYFDRIDGKTNVKDISTLDANSDDPAIAEWGGLSSFASRAAEIVAKNIPL